MYLLRPGDPDVAFFIDAAQVAGAEPAADLRGAGGFFGLPVPGEHVRPAHDELALAVEIDINLLLRNVDQPDLDAG